VAPVATREPAVTLASLEVAFLEEARLAGEGGVRWQWRQFTGSESQSSVPARVAPSIVPTMLELRPPLRLLLSDATLCDVFVRVWIALDRVVTHPCIFGDVIIKQPVCFLAPPYIFVVASGTDTWINYHFVPVLKVFTNGLLVPTVSYFMRVQNSWII
jgi:hypothetical protein